MSDDWGMGSLAQQDEYDPFAAEKFVNPAVQGMMGGIADQVKVPGQMMAPNPYPPGSEEADFYDASKTAGAADWAPGMALNMMGGGVAGTGATAGETALTAGYDPKLWHGVSSIKLPKPIDEMSSLARPINPAPETVISHCAFAKQHADATTRRSY